MGWVCASDARCYEQSSAPEGDASISTARDVDAGHDAATTEPEPKGGPMDAGEVDAGQDARAPEPEPDPTPVVDGPCSTPGAKACLGNASFDKLVCQSGRWIIIGVCDGNYRCNSKPGPSQGSCQPIAPLCLDREPGASICAGLERKRCNADLLGYDPNPCGKNAHCDASAAVRCVCDSGYENDGAGGCRNIDDCASAACGNGRCIDGLNTFTCECSFGYASDGKTCVEVDDCPQTDPCKPGGSCQDALNDFSCKCDAGYMPVGKTCQNIDDCPKPDPCGRGTCVDGVGTFTCMCLEGYYPISSGGCGCEGCDADFGSGCVYQCGGGEW